MLPPIKNQMLKKTFSKQLDSIVLRDIYKFWTRKFFSEKRKIIDRATRIPATNLIGDRSGLAIAAIVKNESRYISEWIEFHAMMGCRAFYIYDNGSSDRTVQLLKETNWSAEVQCMDWRSFDGINNTQRFAYAHALTNFGYNYRWMAFIDIDEFLFPVNGDSLLDKLSRLDNLPGISIPWFNFGFDGHHERPDGLVIENYRERATFPYNNRQRSLLRFKSIVDPSQVVSVGAHTCDFRGYENCMFNENGDCIPRYLSKKKDFAVSNKFRLNHYFTKSEAELIAKLNKGILAKTGKINMGAYDRRLEQYKLSLTNDETIQKFVPRLKRRLKQLNNSHRNTTNNFVEARLT